MQNAGRLVIMVTMANESILCNLLLFMKGLSLKTPGWFLLGTFKLYPSYQSFISLFLEMLLLLRFAAFLISILCFLLDDRVYRDFLCYLLLFSNWNRTFWVTDLFTPKWSSLIWNAGSDKLQLIIPQTIKPK